MIKTPLVEMMDKIANIAKIKHWKKEGRLHTAIYVWDKEQEYDGLLGYVANTNHDNIDSIGKDEWEKILIEPLAEELIDRGYEPEDIIEYKKPESISLEDVKKWKEVDE